MDMYDYAMKMERDGEKFYRDMAEKVDNKGVKKILTMLADEDARHYSIFSDMKKNERLRIAGTPVLENIKNIFERIREERDSGGISASQIGLYERAREIEKKSWDFYLEKAKEAAEPSQKEAFLRIAAEEKSHYYILETIIDFVSRPLQWLEDAEWYHLEEY